MICPCYKHPVHKNLTFIPFVYMICFYQKGVGVCVIFGHYGLNVNGDSLWKLEWQLVSVKVYSAFISVCIHFS